jgi:hypothetical protein
MGKYEQIQDFNLQAGTDYNFGLYSFARWSKDEQLVVVANFNQNTPVNCTVKIPASVIKSMSLKDGNYEIEDQLYKKFKTQLKIQNQEGSFSVALQPNESYILRIK